MFCVLESAKTEAKNSGRMNDVIPVVMCIDRVKCGSTSAMAKSTSRDFSHSGFVAAKVCVHDRTLSWKFAYVIHLSTHGRNFMEQAGTATNVSTAKWIIQM